MKRKLYVYTLLVWVGMAACDTSQNNKLQIDHQPEVLANAAVDTLIAPGYKRFFGTIAADVYASAPLNFALDYPQNMVVYQGKGHNDNLLQLADTALNDTTADISYLSVQLVCLGTDSTDATRYMRMVMNKDATLRGIREFKYIRARTHAAQGAFASESVGRTEYYVTNIKRQQGDNWMVIVKNNRSDDAATRQIAKSLFESIKEK